MKSPLFSAYVQRLIDLNDQLCFYMFNNEELKQKLTSFSEAANPLYTTDLFVNNVYAKKIDITLEKLPQFQEKNRTLNFGAYFSFSYEFFAGYMDDIIKLLVEHNGIIFTNNEAKKDLEKRYKLALEKAGATNLPEIYFETLTYLRLRRNYFTHVLKELNSKFRQIVIDRGTALNAFWVNTILELDFTNQNVDIFLEKETIDLIKILRIMLEELDIIIAPLISKVGISKLICQELYLENPTRINIDVINQRKTAVRNFAQRRFQIVLSDDDMEEAVRTIGIR